MLTARSTRASTVTVNSGMVDFASAMRRAMVACIRLGSTTSTSGPVARGGVGEGARVGADFPAAAASTSSLTMRPSGPLPWIVARLMPSSDASRLARGEALTSTPAPSLPLVAVAGSGAGFEGAGGGALAGFSALTASLGASFGISLGAGLAGAESPTRAIGAPILAGTPCSTRMFKTPSASDSRSNVALSDSTSAITSPFLTGSPLFFFHSTTVPSSIVSESFGIFMSVIERFPTDHLARQLLDVLAGWDRCLLQRQAVGHRHLRAAQPADRGVQVVEAAFLHAGRDLSGDAVRRPAFLDDHAPAGAANGLDDRWPVDGADRAQVDDLGVDVLLLELLGRLVREDGHPRHADDRDIGAPAPDRRLADGSRVVAIRHHAADVVEAHRLEEHHRVVGADGRLQHPLRIFRCRRRDDQQARNEPVQHLEAVRVLRRKLMAGAARHADDQRHLRLAAEHVADLCGVVDDLVVRDQGEVDGHHLDDRSQAEHRRADGAADDHLFRDWCVDDALFAEAIQQAFRHAVRPAELADVLADQVDGVVPLHLLRKRFAQSDAVKLLLGGHLERLSSQRRTLFPFAGVDVLVEIFDLGVGALVGEFDDVLDLGLDLLANRLEVLLVGEA